MTGVLIDHLWQSTLFCAVIWSITLAMRTNSAAVRHWLWLLASMKFLVPFSALHLLGAAAGLPTPVESQPTFFGTALQAATPMVAPALTVPEAQGGAPFALAVGMLAAWILGASCVALRCVRGWHTVYLLSRAARPAPGASPETFITDEDIEPSVARVFHPVVLLPAALLGRLSPAQLDAVLAHEHEHIARRDNLKALLHQIVEILFWFHPLVWFIGRKQRDERERACDEAVLARGHDPGEYAAGILTVCRHCAAVHSTHAVAALAGDLTQRIRHILNGVAPVSLGFIKAFALSTGTLLLAVAPLFAGAVDDAARRRVEVEHHARALWDAQFAVIPVRDDGDRHARLSISDREITIRNSSLRELLALAYGVESRRISGRGEWLDGDRYDIRATLHEDMRDLETFSPLALRTSVNRLLATRFNIEIHVNQRCQYPCGWRALEAADGTR
jgi:beta-lactamase regulating signal transducer with metallopeptidase domain